MGYLYGASVQGIQEFIFATNELKSIVGGSELIKNINKTVEEKYQKHIMINAAGNIKLVFKDDEKEIVEDLAKNFLKGIKQNAYGITISQAVVHFEEGTFKEALQELEERLAIQRNKNDLPLDMSINILKLAPKSARPMVEAEKDTATLQKEKANTSRGNIPKNTKNKTAIIHADGNGLGAMIASMLQNLKSDQEVIEAFKTFSENLDKATNEAYNSAKEGLDDKDIRDVILGGDDMTIICNADYALEFTNKFLAAFEEKTKEYLGKNGLTACAGIAYCNHKFPFHYAVNLAESLCNRAKSHSREDSSILFHNIQSSNFTDYQEYIDKELTLKIHKETNSQNSNDNDEKKETVHLNYGPYFIHKKEPYATVTSFENLAKALMLKGSPASRLREWLTILGKDIVAAKERLKRIDEMMTLKDDIYKKEAFENSLKEFNKELTTDNLICERDGAKYTPVGDLLMHLAVVERSAS